MNDSNQPGLFERENNVRKPDLFAEMYCDGASSGNPGQSGIGVVINILDDGSGHSGMDGHYRIAEYIGTATNNVAEYSALIRGLEKARSLGVGRLRVFLDSELLVRQMNGIYKVKNRNLMVLWNRAREILKAFDICQIIHVRRELNKEADSLAREGVSKGRI